jgi:hypothetical protein
MSETINHLEIPLTPALSPKGARETELRHARDPFAPIGGEGVRRTDEGAALMMRDVRFN